jgi:hypothetical protein
MFCNWEIHNLLPILTDFTDFAKAVPTPASPSPIQPAHKSCNTAEGRVGGTSVLFTEVPPSPTIFSHSLRKYT